MTPPASPVPCYLTPPQLAARLEKSVGTLAKWRLTGYGPRYVKVGRSILYSEADLHVWMNEHTLTSTSDARSFSRVPPPPPAFRIDCKSAVR